jgi:lysozyme
MALAEPMNDPSRRRPHRGRHAKRSTRRRNTFRVVVVVAVVTVSVLVLRPSSSHVPLPASGNWGIDVSSHQGSIDWRSVATDNIRFVYIKATQGDHYVDPEFRADWTGARQSGLRTGAYHFFTFCSSGVSQAVNFLRVIPKSANWLPPAVDLETSSTCTRQPTVSEFTHQLNAFVHLVDRVTKQQLIYYVGTDLPVQYRAAIPSGARLWLYSAPDRPLEKTWYIWQANLNARVPGVRGAVDLDVSHESYVATTRTTLQ